MLSVHVTVIYKNSQLYMVVHLSEKCVLVVSDGNVLVLCSVGDDLNQPTDLRLGIQGHAEQLCRTQADT